MIWPYMARSRTDPPGPPTMPIRIQYSTPATYYHTQPRTQARPEIRPYARSVRKTGLALQHSAEDRQDQWRRYEPGGPQREFHLWSARDHRRATTVGGFERVGDDPLGGNPGERR